MKSNNDINFTSSRTLIGSLIGCIIGFFLMLFKHAILGFFIFFIAAVITIISFTSLSVLTSPNGKRLENGFKSGCLTSFIAFVLLIVGLTVGMPDTPSPSMSDSAVPPETTSQINTLDSAESLESKDETIVPLEVESSEESKIESKVESDVESKTESSELESSKAESSEAESSKAVPSEPEPEPSSKEPESRSYTEHEKYEVSAVPVQHQYVFIINTDSNKIHKSSCNKGQEVLPEHRSELIVTATSEYEAVNFVLGNYGYDPCGICMK